MTPPTSIDGTDISSATIDGQEVQEITVDGQTVFTAGPPLEYLAYSAFGTGSGFPDNVFIHDIPGFGFNTEITRTSPDIGRVRFSPDQNFIAYSEERDDGRKVNLHNVPSFGFFDELNLSEGVVDIDFSPDSNFLAAAMRDGGKLDVFRVPSLNFEAQLNPFADFSTTRFCRFSPDGSLIVFASSGSLKAADVPSFSNERQTGADADFSTRAVAFSPDSSLLVLPVDRGDVDILNVPGFSKAATLDGGSPGAMSTEPSFSPDGRYLAFGTQSGEVRIADMQDFTLDTTLTTDDSDDFGQRPKGIDFDSKGEFLAFSEAAGTIFVHEGTPPFSRITKFSIPGGGEATEGGLVFNV